MDRVSVAILILAIYLYSSAAHAYQVDGYVFHNETRLASGSDKDGVTPSEGKSDLINPCDAPFLSRPQWCYFSPPPSHRHHDGGDHNKERPICEPVSNLVNDCPNDFYLDGGIRDHCCQEVSRISHGCFGRNLRHTELESLSVIERICSEHSSPLPQPPSPLPQPPSPPSSRSPPLPAFVPKPKQTTPTPPASSPPPPPVKPRHLRRPTICLVETVVFDSCNPKYPEANKNASRRDRDFVPQGMSSGLLKDSAGCCLGFAVFTNDCNPTIKDLSVAKQGLYSSLQDSCGKLH